jgi:hypothetical protein
MLKKELVLYDRDEKGELIPKATPLVLSEKDLESYPDLKGEEVAIVPITRGELKALFNVEGTDSDVQPETDKDGDAEIIIKYCKSPVFTEEELKYAKPVIIRSIVRTIFAESGVKFDETTGEKVLDKKQDEFGKN